MDIPVQIHITARKANGVAGDEAACLRVVVAGPVVIQARFAVPLAAREAVGGGEGAGGEDNHGAVKSQASPTNSGSTEDRIVIARHRFARGIGDGADAAQAVGMEKMAFTPLLLG